MKLKVLLPWICVLGLSAGLASVFVASRAKDTELARLRTESAQAQQWQTDLAAAQSQSQKQTEQIAELRKDTTELLRLRSEVGQLRTEKQQLAKQIAAAQAAAHQALSQVAETTQATAQQLQQMQSQNQQLRTAVVQQGAQALQHNACINNLRQIDAAQQQWALEHNKTAEARPTAQDIVPYLKDNLMPACPAGGAYALNGLTNLPTCSIPGHVLSNDVP